MFRSSDRVVVVGGGGGERERGRGGRERERERERDRHTDRQTDRQTQTENADVGGAWRGGCCNRVSREVRGYMGVEVEGVGGNC